MFVFIVTQTGKNRETRNVAVFQQKWRAQEYLGYLIARNPSYRYRIIRKEISEDLFEIKQENENETVC